MVPFLPVLQSVAAVGPKLRSVGCDLEPMMANEEEVVRTLGKPIEMQLGVRIWAWPNEDPGKDISKDFWRDTGDVQQRVSSAFELDDVSVAVLYLPLQDSYRLCIDLQAHANPTIGSG